jgi:hypothetical protein
MYDLGWMIDDLKIRSRHKPRCDPQITQITQIQTRAHTLRANQSPRPRPVHRPWLDIRICAICVICGHSPSPFISVYQRSSLFQLCIISAISAVNPRPKSVSSAQSADTSPPRFYPRSSLIHFSILLRPPRAFPVNPLMNLRNLWILTSPSEVFPALSAPSAVKHSNPCISVSIPVPLLKLFFALFASSRFIPLPGSIRVPPRSTPCMLLRALRNRVLKPYATEDLDCL